MKSAFGGSALKLVASALGNAKTSPQELEAIRELITRIEAGDGEPNASDQ
jgi:hypothetical protein